MEYIMKYKQVYWTGWPGEERMDFITLDKNIEARDDDEALEKARMFIVEKNENKHLEEIDGWEDGSTPFSVKEYKLLSLTRIDQKEITTSINIYHY